MSQSDRAGLEPSPKKGGREGDFGIPTPSGGGEKEGLDKFFVGTFSY